MEKHEHQKQGAGVAEERVERADQAAEAEEAGEIGQQDGQDGEGGLPRPVPRMQNCAFTFGASTFESAPRLTPLTNGSKPFFSICWAREVFL